MRIFSSYFVKDSEVLMHYLMRVSTSFTSFQRRFYMKFCSICEWVWSSINKVYGYENGDNSNSHNNVNYRNESARCGK